jgi:hypothetical protein
VNTNDIRFKEDIVRSLIKTPRTEGISLRPKDIVVNRIVISRFYCIMCLILDAETIVLNELSSFIETSFKLYFKNKEVLMPRSGNPAVVLRRSTSSATPESV